MKAFVLHKSPIFKFSCPALSALPLDVKSQEPRKIKQLYIIIIGLIGITKINHKTENNSNLVGITIIHIKLVEL